MASQCPAVHNCDDFKAKQQADGEQPPLHQKARNNFVKEFAEKGAQWKMAFQYLAVHDCNSFAGKQQADGEQPPLHPQARNSVNFFGKMRKKARNGMS